MNFWFLTCFCTAASLSAMADVFKALTAILRGFIKEIFKTNFGTTKLNYPLLIYITKICRTKPKSLWLNYSFRQASADKESRELKASRPS